jgi:hypothetical protein
LPYDYYLQTVSSHLDQYHQTDPNKDTKKATYFRALQMICSICAQDIVSTSSSAMEAASGEAPRRHGWSVQGKVHGVFVNKKSTIITT